MLTTLHNTQELNVPVYGMHRGTVGFLMNDFSEDGLMERLNAAEEAETNPLRMRATRPDGYIEEALAINEVSLLRAGPQAAKLRILVDEKERMEELVCDGALVATPAGSTAYNYSAHGPILPIGADVLALTAMAAFRPRRWRGALLPKTATVIFEVIDPKKRPVSAVADSQEVRLVHRVCFPHQWSPNDDVGRHALGANAGPWLLPDRTCFGQFCASPLGFIPARPYL